MKQTRRTILKALGLAPAAAVAAKLPDDVDDREPEWNYDPEGGHVNEGIDYANDEVHQWHVITNDFNDDAVDAMLNLTIEFEGKVKENRSIELYVGDAVEGRGPREQKQFMGMIVTYSDSQIYEYTSPAVSLHFGGWLPPALRLALYTNGGKIKTVQCTINDIFIEEGPRDWNNAVSTNVRFGKPKIIIGTKYV